MIEKFIEEGTSPKFDVLIIDEAQDLVPLQWKMVKEVLVPNSKEVFMQVMMIKLYMDGWV